MTFTELWYPDEQLEDLADLLDDVLIGEVEGHLVEIGCWEGRSTVVLASVAAAEGRILHAVDWWKGNLDEGEGHPSVVGARTRDVQKTFMENIAPYGNVQVHNQSGDLFLQNLIGRIAFIHLDAGHTYGATKRLIDLAKPRMATGGIICGDDFLNAHAGREDLDGGVERAVAVSFEGYSTLGNLWYHLCS